MSLDLNTAPDLTDEQAEALTEEELETWQQACVRHNLRALCEHLWPVRQPCFTCGGPATWHYDPKTDNPASHWACADCVPRGCSCMATAAYDDAEEAAGAPLPFDPERDGFRLADGCISPCIEWSGFTDPATLPAVEDLAGWEARRAAGQVP